VGGEPVDGFVTPGAAGFDEEADLHGDREDFGVVGYLTEAVNMRGVSIEHLRTSLCFALILSVIESRSLYPKKGPQPTSAPCFLELHKKMTNGGSVPGFPDS
jgi:hypothetical protein